MDFFFFKHKTAYEMRISDWSSDVCSSDLPPPASHLHQPPGHVRNRPYISGCACHGNARRPVLLLPSDLHKTMPSTPDDERHAPLRPCQRWSTAPGSASSESAYARDRTRAVRRSEERRVGKARVSPCRSRWSAFP